MFRSILKWGAISLGVLIVLGAVLNAGDKSAVRSETAKADSKPPGKIARDRGNTGTDTTDTSAQEKLEDINEMLEKNRPADVTYTSSCDMMMPSDIMSGDYRFVGAAKMHNEGQEGTDMRVKIRFDQVSSPTITATKIVHVKGGPSNKTVKFSIPATQSQIDEYQSSPDYTSMDGDACKVKATMIG